MSVHTIREFEFPAPQDRERRMRARRRRRNRRILITLMATLFVAGGLTGLMFFANRQIIPSGPLSADAALPEPLFGRAGRTIDGVPFYSQIGEFPTGCEGVSAAMLLGYYGMDVAPGEFIDGFLPLGDAPYETDDGQWAGCDPWAAFPGDPVLVWATIDMDPPHTGLTWTVPETGQEITWIVPMHCLVLIGYDDTGYIFNDPLAGEAVHYERAAVEEAYEALYAQAVILETE